MVDTLLDRFHGVRSIGPDKWVALCPTHKDRKPSLTFRRLDDGRWLIHCWAGCATAEVLADVGLSMESLFPKRQGLDIPGRPIKRPWSAADMLHMMDKESLVILCTVAKRAEVGGLEPREMERLLEARSRIREVMRWLPN